MRMVHLGGLRGLPIAAFFSFHYSFFCAVPGIFLLTLTDAGDEHTPSDDGAGFPLLLPFHRLRNEVEYIHNAMPALLGLPLLALIMSHGASTAYHHFRGGEDTGREPSDIMFDPYKRIIALHIAIILGAIALFKVGADQAIPALVFLVSVKIVIDTHQHRRAHRNRQTQRTTGQKPPHDELENDEIVG